MTQQDLVVEDVKARLAALFESAAPEELNAYLEGLQPYDLASVLRELDDAQKARLLTALAPATASETLEHLDFDEQYHILVDLLEETTSKTVLASMSTDALADLAGSMHPRDAQALFARIPEADLQQVRRLLSYPENSAGGRATTDYLQVRRQWTADQVLAYFRRVGRDVEIAHYVYVVDRYGRLVGVTSMRDIILAEPKTSVEEVMQRQVVSVPALADQEEAANLLKQYDFGAVPVLDSGGRLVGVISVDDVLDVAEEEATEDIQKSAAVTPLERSYRRAGVLMLYQRRVWWLGGLVLVSLVSAGILAAYEAKLQTTVALAFFIPLLLGSGGNTGSQSATLMIRALATRDVEMREWARTLSKELGVGALLGVSLGLLASGIGYFFGGWHIGLVVGLTMVSIVIVANLIGMLLPFLLSKLNLDPAVASSPLIASVTDALGLVIYFSYATFILTHV